MICIIIIVIYCTTVGFKYWRIDSLKLVEFHRNM